MPYDYPIISADSHITEPPDCYIDRIDPAYRDRAPRVVDGGERGDLFEIPGMRFTVPMGLVAAAGKDPTQITRLGVKFGDLHRSGWDPTVRLADQERDGVAAEVLYPTVGMMLCNHEDFDYKKACFDAYNRWIAEYSSESPGRLLGVGQTAMRSPAEGVADLRAIAAAGLRGVMMPGQPQEADYDSPIYDGVWETAVQLGLPLSFHVLTTRSGHARGPKLNDFLSIVRAIQDILGMFVFSGVFERHPGLRIVCVEADAGWASHYMYRMDHVYNRHRHHTQPGAQLQKLPSEYFAEHIYLTFQDDWTAFRHANELNWERLMWANDFPHSDSTWPWSQEMLAAQTKVLTDDQTRAILSGNAAALYGIDLSVLPIAA